MKRVHGFLGYLGQSKVLSWRKQGVYVLPPEEFVILGIEADVVFVNIRIQLIRAQNLGYFNQLVVIVMSVEEGFFPKDLIENK
jgi:hypothetical protein